MMYHEINFDGLIGPSHNYAGLAFGNLASQKNAQGCSNPRAAALQGLEKMKTLMDMGLRQGVIPPHGRPDFSFLRDCGFSGSRQTILDSAFKSSPHLLTMAYSASSMWTANMLTMSPSCDTRDGRAHFTVANLLSQGHRAIEASFNEKLAQTMFGHSDSFVHHSALAKNMMLTDEGAANHMRLSDLDGANGLNIFVYDRLGAEPLIADFPRRQTREASEAVARFHGLSPDATFFVRQHNMAIAAGAFHNDVVGVSNKNVLFLHGQSFENQTDVLNDIVQRYKTLCTETLYIIECSATQISLEKTVSSYLFNSQLVDLSMGGMALICPSECKEDDDVSAYLSCVVAADNPIVEVKFVDVRESMRNGGGPACLRLRLTLCDEELAAIHQGCILTPQLYEKLKTWIKQHYRDQLVLDDLRDSKFADECAAAILALSKTLDLPILGESIAGADT